MPKGAETWAGGYPVHVFAGKGEVREWGEFIEPATLKTMIRFAPETVAQGSFDLLKDKEGKNVLRATYTCKAGAQAKLEFRLPIAGAPRRLAVHLGCPDKSVESIMAEIDDKDGETFGYKLVQMGSGPVPPYADCSLDCRAAAGNWSGRVANAVLEPPCVWRCIWMLPMPGRNEGTLDLWGIQVYALAPAEDAAH
jgi:hypothetical protein